MEPWQPLLSPAEAVEVWQTIEEIAATLRSHAFEGAAGPVAPATPRPEPEPGPAAGPAAAATSMPTSGPDAAPAGVAAAPGGGTEAAPGIEPGLAAALEELGRRREISVAGGAAGQALFFAYLALHRADEAAAAEAVTLLETASEGVASTPTTPDLYAGFPGVAWVTEHLQGKLFEPEPAAADSEVEDPNGEIDEALLLFLGHTPWDGDYDLIRGLTGLGFYALERLPRESGAACLEAVISRLDEMAEQSAEGVTWFTRPELLPPWQRELYPSGYYNLGVAHGVPATIALLAGAVAAGVGLPRSRELLTGAVRWLLAHRLAPGSASCFGYSFSSETPAAASRLAWCYGDPGIAGALLASAEACGEPAWRETALEIALSAAGRSVESSGVRDAGLCHGAAGLAHLFNRMYQATGDERLAQAARTWLQNTLEWRTPGAGLAGFRAFMMNDDKEPGWRDDPGLLEGIAGIGLALLAAVSPVEPAWDRLLAISLPPRREA